MAWYEFSPSDAFAVGMLVVIAMGMGVILTLFLSMKRHSKRRDPAVDELIQEVTRLEKSLPEAEQAKAPPVPPWEKPADWWKPQP